MKVNIPSDWDGNEWTCVKLAWPNSAQWLSLLAGLVTSPTRGRWYNEQSGTIKDAQEIGLAILDRNLPFTLCNDAMPAPQTVVEYLRGAGIVIMESDDMGQVVTDVTIENGVLKVWFGPCCVQSYVLGQSVTPITPSPGESGAIDFSDWATPPTFTGSGRAEALLGVLSGVIDIICDSTGSSTPIGVAREIIRAYPDIDFGDLDLLTATIAGVNVVAQGFCSELEDPALYQTIKADWAGILADQSGDLTQEQYEALVTAAETRAKQWFTLLTYPTAYSDMRSIISHVMRSLGRNDTSNLLAYAWDSESDDVSYPTSDPLAGMDWVTDYDFTQGQMGFVANADGEWIEGAGWRSLSINERQITLRGPATPDPLTGVMRYVWMEFRNYTNHPFDVGVIEITNSSQGAVSSMPPLTPNALNASTNIFEAWFTHSFEITADSTYKMQIRLRTTGADNDGRIYVKRIVAAGMGDNPFAGGV